MQTPCVSRRSLLALLASARGSAATVAAFLSSAPAAAQRQITATPEVEPARYAQLKYRHIGPEGNRAPAVAGISGDPSTYYAGAASGGIWKTTDAGLTWSPIFDGQLVHSIGALAVAASDPNVVWAGTGEPFIRSHISLGWGVFKSTDAGKTWSKMGLDNTGRIARVIVHPTNPELVYVAALGHAYGSQQERGIYRTSDGGKTWERILFVSDSAGASDLVMDPNNPRILFAGMWQIEIHTWGRESGGPHSGIWKTTDGGTTWKRLTGNGLPTGPIGKIGLGVTRSNSNRVYALIETSDGVPWKGEASRGELWRSEDAGETWQLVSYDRELGGRTHYYNRMAVAPDDPDEAYFLAASYSKTLDGGRSTVSQSFGSAPGWDHHDMWIDPADADRMIIGHDGGVSISTNRGKSWFRQQLPIAQMYHVTVDNRVPYFVYGNKQDGPSYRGPSNSKLGGFGGPFTAGIQRGLWQTVGGGESGMATPDPTDSNIVWSSASGSGARGGIVTRYDLRTGVTRNVEIWPISTGGWPAAELKYRFIWDFPILISPHDPRRMYAVSQHVHLTTDGGNTWQTISPDLTRNDKSRQQISGGLTPDNIGVEYAGALYALAESPLQAGVLWAGSNDGLVHVTQDGGGTWTNVTANVPSLPAWGSVSSIKPSRYDAGTAYLTVELHQVNNRDPFAYKTTDFGRTWRSIVNGIPRSPLSYVRWIEEDPVRRGLLYLGTENALYVSFDDGEHWQPLQNNLPAAPVYAIVVQSHFNDLVVGTYGRGFWILDDVTPLQQLTPEVIASGAHLFTPRAAYRFRQVEGPAAPLDDPTVGQNPPYGASFNYWLQSQPEGDVKLAILDTAGAVVRTLDGTKHQGVNRVWWDLRFEPSKQARIRVSPQYAPEVTVGAEGMPAPGVGRLSLLAPPGTYTVRLSVGGREYTRPLEVRKDPNSGGSVESIREQTALLTEIRTTHEGAVDMVNAIELIRRQLQELKIALTGDANASVRAAADSLEQKLIAVEEQLHQTKLTGRGQDGVRWPIKLAGQLNYLAGTIAGSDESPTTQAREAYRYLADQVRSVRTQYDRVIGSDVAGFNALLRQRNVPNVIITAP